MQLSEKQRGVVKGMALAMLLSLLTIAASVVLKPLGLDVAAGFKFRAQILALSLLLPSLLLLVAIARLAKYRFFSPEDIDGSGLSVGTKRAVLLQSLLQNTLEQFVLACAVYTAWCLLMPLDYLSVTPVCSIVFALARLRFFMTYPYGAAARAFAFALTFYPTAILLAVVILYKLVVLLKG